MTVDFKNVDRSALNFTRAIALQEGGGKVNYNAVGDNGTSTGAYQWQPGNFQAMAKEAGLDPNDFSPTNQDKVAYARVKTLKDQGYKPWQIASMWNSGSPDNWQNHSGTTTINGKEISYDTPSYVAGVNKYYQQLSGGADQTPPPSPVASTAPESSASNVEMTNGLGVDLGGTGVGPVDLSGAIFNAGKSVFTGVENAVKEGGQGIADALTAVHEGRENPIEAGVQVFKNTAHAMASPITETAGKILSPLNHVIEPVAKIIEDTPTVQAFTEFMSKYPRVADALSNLIQGGLDTSTLVAPEEVKKTAEVTNLNPIDTVSNIVDTAKTKMRGSFEDNVNKALPVLKNDVRNLPKKYQNVETALTDIVDNKDSLGLTDKAGGTRLPDTFLETAEAQAKRMNDLYKQYSSRLIEVDRAKFDADISDKVKSQIDTLNNQLEKENNLSKRSALTRRIKELQTLRDTSPEGIQSYIESLNQEARTAPGAPMNTNQITAANLAGQMRDLLDDSISKIEGDGYKDLRAKYAAHRALRDQFLMAAKKELNKTPGLTEKLANMGVSAEGLNFLLTHNPKSLLIAAGVKLNSALIKWFSSPQRALQNLYEGISDGSYRSTGQRP